DFLQRELDVNHGDTSLPFDFVGGWVGCVGYEVKADLGEAVKHHATTPDGLFIFVDEFLAFDHASREIYVVCVGSPNDAESLHQRASTKAKALRETDMLVGETGLALGGRLHCSSEVRYNLSKSAYMEKVEACKASIRDGESYEICQTMNATMQTDCDPLALHLRLRRSSPAPYAGYFCVGDITVVCASPERFLKIDRSGMVESKPIKGTAARSSAPDIDRQERDRLRHSAKNQAENLMIVDLLRHDLSWVCEPGSVHVPALMDIESYQTVHQMVSTIRGQLRADVGVVDCLRHAFPGGSMTGAPKARTMDLLNELEGEARGIYSGTFGYFSINGCADLNIVIRTAVFSDGRVQVGMGGAVTLLSDAKEEYAEAILKGDVVLNALRAAQHAIPKA
ncbi:MAG: aminodeoxychorismate synthase component I, partial [Kiritimatiellae bacterium]|nr:aminodeoxychorismate synthase component I [Kiritimatiellia bacterium]